MDPTVLALLSILLEMEKEFQAGRERHKDTPGHAGPTENIADA